MPHSTMREFPTVSDSCEGGCDSAERVANFLAKERDRSHTDHRDQADEHTVFDEGSALLVTAEAIYDLEHVEVLPESWASGRIRAAFSLALRSRRRFNR